MKRVIIYQFTILLILVASIRGNSQIVLDTTMAPNSIDSWHEFNSVVNNLEKYNIGDTVFQLHIPYGVDSALYQCVITDITNEHVSVDFKFFSLKEITNLSVGGGEPPIYFPVTGTESQSENPNFSKLYTFSLYSFNINFDHVPFHLYINDGEQYCYVNILIRFYTLFQPHTSITSTCENSDSTSMSISCSLTPESLLWQVDKNDNNGFVDIDDNFLYSGITTPNLIIYNPTFEYNNYLYRCIGVFNSDTITSFEHHIVVNPVNVTNEIIGETTPPAYSNIEYGVIENIGSNYLWFVENGYTYSTGNNITINWNSEGHGSVCVLETNEYGCVSDSVCLNVSIMQCVLDGYIVGETNCATNQYYYYFIENNTSQIYDYDWTIEGGIIIDYWGSEVYVQWNNNGVGSLCTTTQEYLDCDGNSICLDISVNVNTVIENNLCNVYPNPSNGYLFVEVDNLKKIEIYNYTGKYMMSSSSKYVDLTDKPKGIYFLRIYTYNNILTKKIIIE